MFIFIHAELAFKEEMRCWTSFVEHFCFGCNFEYDGTTFDFRLLVLDISHSDRITDAGINLLCQSCRFLQFLNVSYLPNLTLDSFFTILNELRNLWKVSFKQSNDYMTDDMFQALCCGFHTFKSIDLSGCVISANLMPNFNQ